jgi:hypothetical protein
MEIAVLLYQHAHEIAAELEKVASTCGNGANADKGKLKDALGATSNTECIKFLTTIAAGLRTAAAEVEEAKDMPGKLCAIGVTAGGRRPSRKMTRKRKGKGKRKGTRRQRGGCATVAVLFLTALAAYLVARGMRQADRPPIALVQWLLGIFAFAMPQQANAFLGEHAPAQFENAGLHLGNMGAPIPDRMRATFPNAARFNAAGQAAPLTANNMERILSERNYETRNIRANVNRRAGLPANHGANSNVRLNSRSTAPRGPTYRGMTAAERNAEQQANLERRLVARRNRQ